MSWGRTTSIIARKCAISLSDRGGREGSKTYLKCVTFRKKLRTYEMLPKKVILYQRYVWSTIESLSLGIYRLTAVVWIRALDIMVPESTWCYEYKPAETVTKSLILVGILHWSTMAKVPIPKGVQLVDGEGKWILCNCCSKEKRAVHGTTVYFSSSEDVRT